MTHSAVLSHYVLDHLPLMMGDLPESVASGSNTFAQKIGSAGGYDSDNLWSAGVAVDFSTGIGRSLAEGGIYYAELDTRRPAAVLPPLARIVRLAEFAQNEEDTSGLARHAYFAEGEGRIFMAVGVRLYEWIEGLQAWQNKFHTGLHATSLAYFDGYLHVAGWRPINYAATPDTPGHRDYLWIRIDNFEYGFDTTEVPGITTPSIFHPFGGLLYCAQGNNLYYTAGSQQEDDDTNYPKPPWQWEWIGPVRFGSKGDSITGIAGVIYQQLGQRYVYVSTESMLNVLLPGDIPFGVTPWPMRSPTNGVGMKTFYNRIYIPVGGDLFALQSNGDLISSGVDNSPEGLPQELSGNHWDIATSANLPFVTVRGASQSTVWAGKASSWHFVGKMNTDDNVIGAHFTDTYGRLFVVTDSGVCYHYYLGNTSRPVRYDNAYRYAPSGVIDTGWYTGALFEQHKYWHSVFVDVNCLTEESSVELRYIADDEDVCANTTINYDDWHSLGFVTHDQQELTFGYQLSSKRVRVVALMRSSDPKYTPEIRSIGIRYTPKIVDRNRWSITVKLPRHELYDAAGNIIEDYDQATFDNQLDGLRKRTKPIFFRDLDGKQYWVLVTGVSRRVHSVGNKDCEVPALEYDVDWSFALTEVANEVQDPTA